MPNYRRAWYPGGSYCFTVNLLERHNNDLLIKQIEQLCFAIKKVKQDHPFIIHGWVVLPEPMHFLIELPENDSNYVQRIKKPPQRGGPTRTG